MSNEMTGRVRRRWLEDLLLRITREVDRPQSENYCEACPGPAALTGWGQDGKVFTPFVAVLWGPTPAWGLPRQATLGLKTQDLVSRNAEIRKSLAFLGKKKKEKKETPI